MKNKEIVKKISELNIAINDYFLKLNEHSIWLFLAIIGWLGIPEKYENIKILALFGIVLFFFSLLSQSKAWMLAGKKSFKSLILQYKNEIQTSSLSEFKKNRELSKLNNIETRYFNFRKNGLSIVYKNYCFFFTIFFVAIVVIIEYCNFKI
ncbi:hypothetical protein [Acinetobacter guillouiae]|uniref:hypothetical protein n=1 Tax=Acinetobacter guillouiae TaxID=106649 RepID=UPI001AE659E0|nr:hypothetical protein [Acinetobacter guillouiae]MBP2544536.1 hypothetical protein [Acinetobacter guillouiae]